MLGEIKRGRYSTNKLTGVKGNRISGANERLGRKDRETALMERFQHVWRIQGLYCNVLHVIILNTCIAYMSYHDIWGHVEIQDLKKKKKKLLWNTGCIFLQLLLLWFFRNMTHKWDRECLPVTCHKFTPPCLVSRIRNAGFLHILSDTTEYI